MLNLGTRASPLVKKYLDCLLRWVPMFGAFP
uniref:Uncharacterized protein n=1 Tax=Rhizophora mucronata TaxID=61149 RepID=A0A2P2N711_RHIMU